MKVERGTASMWLFNCLNRGLGDEILKANPGTEPLDMTEAALTASIKETGGEG